MSITSRKVAVRVKEKATSPGSPFKTFPRKVGQQDALDGKPIEYTISCQTTRMRLFYLFEWSDTVTDIREQFPLLDLDKAMSIATDMGIKYPTDPTSGTPYVLTTDFMLTVNQLGKSVQVARTVKPAFDLEKKSVAEKLELERRYYASQNIDWGIVTEKEIPRLLAENVEWVHAAYRLEATAQMDVFELRSLFNILKRWLALSHGTINQVTTALDREMNIEPGTSLYLFKHLLARKEIKMDMLTQKISGCPSAQALLTNSFG